MDLENLYEPQKNSVEVIRDGLRDAAKIERLHQRILQWNKHRTALGEVESDEQSWDLTMIIKKTEELKKKKLSIDDYLKLQTSLIQDEKNIDAFLSVHNIIPALIRDISSANPAKKLAAIHCCCNVSLINTKRCSMLYKYAGPHLIWQLDTPSNPILEVIAWTIGNLCGGSKSAFKFLYAQGCIGRLLSVLRECDTMILPSIIYAITHCLHTGMELMSDAEILEIAQILIKRGCFKIAPGLWILALLSSKITCGEINFSVLSLIFDNFVLKLNDECPDTIYITAAIRFFANSVAESSGSAADIILHNSKYSIEDIQSIFDKLLLYPYVHVRKETLWLIGNLYNNPQREIHQTIISLLPHLLNLNYAIASIN